jgi:hypothetical protein
MSKKVKIFAIIVGVLVVGILAFTFLGNSSPVPVPTPLSSSATMPGAPGSLPAAVPGVAGVATTMPSTASINTFSNALAGINGITLDTSIFSNAAYKALRDYPITLGTAVIGRQNPFAPIGTDSGSVDTSTAAAVLVQTLAPSKVLTTSATFGALVKGQDNASIAGTTVVFQYGTNDTLGSATPPVKVTKSGTALFNVTGLTPATTYSVEAVAVQGSTTATSTIMTFTTTATAGQ